MVLSALVELPVRPLQRVGALAILVCVWQTELRCCNRFRQLWKACFIVFDQHLRVAVVVQIRLGVLQAFAIQEAVRFR